tara:strand:+ start:6119 stop:8944 length:2826 start_codon:yes stop_codon:yes gene_type:complete
MNTRSFLQRALADSGSYCIWAHNKKNERIQQKFYQTIDQVIDKADELDTEGYDCYFALATFKEATSRKVTNVHKLQSFFLDIDCGDIKAEEDKGYATQEEALVALQGFCKTLKLPMPVLINSGRGVHVHWQLSEPVVFDDWYPVAARLKAMTKVHGLVCDNAVTSDAARILRIPSTHNYKTTPPTKVTYFGSAEQARINFDTFSELLGNDPIPVPERTMVEEFSAAVQGMHNNKENYFKDIIAKSSRGDGCAQIAHVMMNPNEVSEPLWFDAVSIIKHCVDGGREGAHKISKGYDGYDAAETDSKYDTTKHVHRCDTFNDNRPDVCTDCKHWGKIGSPITLGQRIKEAEEEDNVVSAGTESGGSETYNIPPYPKPYFRGATGGVYTRSKTEDGDIDEKLIYHNDLYVVKRVQDVESGEGIVMRLHLPIDGVREFTVPLTAVTSKDEFRKHMAMHGVAVTRMDDIMNYTTRWVNELQATTATQHARRQFGWTGDDFESFVLGDKEIFGDRVEGNPPSTPTRDLFHMFKPKGTMEEWKDMVNFYNRDGFELHQYIVATSFGSPLMALSPIACSGFHVHSTESGLGKTTAMYVGASVWGKPKELVIEKNDTQNSRMLRGEVYHNLPLYIDEMTNAKADELSDMIYQLSGGRQKNRMAGGGNTERARGEPWSLLTVTTGNTSIIEKVSLAKAMPKAEAQRMLETKAKKLFDESKTKHLTDDHAYAAENLYGHAGTIYIQYVINNIEEVRTLLTRVQQAIDKEAGLKAENRFWSAGVACTITGAMIARRLGLIMYDTKNLMKYALGLLKENLRNVSEMGSSVQETLNNYLHENWGSVLKIRSTDDLRGGQDNGLDELVIPEVDPRVRLVGRYETDVKKLYLTPKPLKAWCGKQDLNYSSFKEELIKHMGAKDMTMRLTRGTSTQLPPTRVICVDCSNSPIDVAEDA